MVVRYEPVPPSAAQQRELVKMARHVYRAMEAYKRAKVDEHFPGFGDIPQWQSGLVDSSYALIEASNRLIDALEALDRLEGR